MKRFIQTTLFFAVLAVLTINSKTISNFIVDNYNSTINYLASNLIQTVKSLAF